MQKAEERAWEAYPSESHWFNENRAAFIKGYQQAEKDLALTWKDVRSIIKIADYLLNSLNYDKIKKMGEEGYYSEILDRFNKMRR